VIRIVTTAASFAGAVMALAVAVVGFFGGVGIATILLRALLAGAVVAVLLRTLGVLAVRAMWSRMAVESSRTASPSAEADSEPIAGKRTNPERK